MIDIIEEFNSGSRKLILYNYSNKTYTISSNHGLVNNNEIIVNDNIPEIEITISYSDSSIELINYKIKEKTKTYFFNNSFLFEREKEHLFLNGYIKRYFPSWSTSGKTDFSSTSRLLSSIVFSSFNKELNNLLLEIEEEGSSTFPLTEKSIVKTDYPSGPIGNILDVFMSHIHNFIEENVTLDILERVYSYGENIIIGNEGRKELVIGDKDKIYSSKLLYGRNNNLKKEENGLINSQTFKQLITHSREPLSYYPNGNILTISEKTDINFYSPIRISKILGSIFGDIFILGEDNHLYYTKTEIDIPDILELNPSINNNNIVDIGNDYFCPTDSIEVIIDLEYLRNIKAKNILIKVSNQNNSFYIIGNEEFSLSEKRIPVSDSKNLKFILDTEDTDRFIKVEVFVDQEKLPYIGFSSARLLDLKKINENKYSDLFARNNRIHVKRIISNNPIVTEAKIISGKYACSIEREGKYVSFKV